MKTLRLCKISSRWHYEKSVKGFVVSCPIKFQIGLKSEVEGDGKVRIVVVEGGVSKTRSEDAKVEFEIDDSNGVLLNRFIDLINKTNAINASARESEKNVKLVSSYSKPWFHYFRKMRLLNS